MTNGMGNAYTTGGRPQRGPRNKVKFTANVPQTLVLEMDPPDEAAPSQWGEEYMYSIAGGFVLFAPAELHIEILRTRAKAHHQLTIVKRTMRNAAGNSTTWEVENNTLQAQGWQSPTPTHATQRDPRADGRETPTPRALAARPEARPAAEALKREMERRPDTTAEFTGTRPARAEALPAFQLSKNPMTHALRMAMEAIHEAQFEEATREDIRALAITIYIQAAKDLGK